MLAHLLEAELADGVVRLTLNRPEQRNALDAALIGALHEAVLRHGERAQTRVLLIDAAGTSFCAGADLTEMHALGQGPLEANLREGRRLAQLLLALRESPKPTLAVVQGPAYGGGVGLAAACDVALGSVDARFRLPEVRLGLTPATISPYVIEALGPRQARRYVLSGEVIDAARACELGLLHAVSAAELLATDALTLAHEIAAGGPQALAAAKSLIAAVAHRSPGTALADDTAARLAQARAGAEAQEGLSAALERRVPTWRAS